MEGAVMERYPRCPKGFKSTRLICVTCLQIAENSRHTIDDCVSTVEAFLKGLKIEAIKQHTDDTG